MFKKKQNKLVPVSLLTGYLGAGKTSVKSTLTPRLSLKAAR